MSDPKISRYYGVMLIMLGAGAGAFAGSQFGHWWAAVGGIAGTYFAANIGGWINSARASRASKITDAATSKESEAETELKERFLRWTVGMGMVSAVASRYYHADVMECAYTGFLTAAIFASSSLILWLVSRHLSR
jgi:hypothetical protein